MPIQDDPPPPKTFLEEVKDWWQGVKQWFGGSAQPTSTATLPPPNVTIIHATGTPTLTLMPTLTSTSTPTITPRPTLESPRDELRIYGIEPFGMNTIAEKVLLEASHLVGVNLMPILGVSSPDEAFRKANGAIAVIVDPNAVFFDPYGNIASGNCQTTQTTPRIFTEPFDFREDDRRFVAAYQTGTGEEKRISTSGFQAVICKEPPTLENMIHEFGHTAPMHLNYDILNKFTSIPYGNGEYLDEKDGYWIREGIGFKNGEDSLEHKINSHNESQVDGYAKVEQFADMFLNWNMEQVGSENYGFTNDEAGSARGTFIEGLIRNMLGQP